MLHDYKEVLVLLMVIHIIGDFYFQNENITSNKEKNLKWVVLYSSIYGFVYFSLIKIIIPSFNDSYLLMLIMSHLLIDIVKFYGMKNKFLVNRANYMFFMDQFLHFITLMIIAYFIVKSTMYYEYNLVLQDVLHTIGLPIQSILFIALQFLLIHKPVNMAIVIMMQAYKPANNNPNDTVKAGRMIGTIERIIMLFFLSIQQYSSIGLVLTVKSIARYNKISEDQMFAEYYLLGTLLSTLCVLMISLIC